MAHGRKKVSYYQLYVEQYAQKVLSIFIQRDAA